MQYSSILMIVALFVLMYFMMIRPQKKQQQKQQDMMNQLKPGDAVVTIGRLHGVIDSFDEEAKTVTLDCDGIFLTFERSAIARVLLAAVEVTPAAKEEEPAVKEEVIETKTEEDKASSDEK
ncbi:preprotein translocase subunit YajC [Dellaglioa carnosa]|uniref:preprotein translocase subunit YajC n=1 Tax=Dellaglioa carnosa TaxID=2995136 RepID=UPI0022A888F5|nr:preprotein translocase subunit YajC [Dellaglioa carnosa]MCZ2492947.1 preprotein translocase subunit YajC [Dellaglioa carnosa]